MYESKNFSHDIEFSFWLMHVSLTNHVAVRLFSNRSQRTLKCGKNKKVAHEAQPSVSLMLLYKTIFVLYNEKLKYTENSPLWQTQKWLWCDLMSIQNEANWLVAIPSKELWLVQIQNSKNLESSAVVIYASVLS